MNGDNLVLAGFAAIAVGMPLGLWLLRRHVQRQSSSGWRLVLLGNAFLLGSLVSMTLLAGEIYYRFIYDTTDSFVSTKTSRKWFERHWRENSSGCRDNIDYRPRISAGKRRITFVGDSFTAGQGINDPEDRFANILRRRHPDWEIHVLAFPGFDTGGQVDYLRSCCERGYELGDVVLVYCLNDVSDLIPAWLTQVQTWQADWDKRSWLRKHSFFADALAYRWEVRHNSSGYFDFVQSAYTNNIWPTQAERLDQFRQIVESHGGRLYVMTFPFLHNLGTAYPFTKVHQQLTSFWKERNIPHLDLLATYVNHEADELIVNSQDAHPSVKANALAADALEAFLADFAKRQP